MPTSSCWLILRETSSASSPEQYDGGSPLTALADPFVAANQQGAELDVHLIEVRGSAVVALGNVPWDLDRESLDGRGTIAGRPVSCVSARAQVAMHRDYELPETHQRDVVRLLRLG